MQEAQPSSLSDLEAVAETLEASGNYQVLRRLVVPAYYNEPAPSLTQMLRGLIVDVETTGLDTASDAVIEFAAVPFDFDSEGIVYAVHPVLSFLEDPGRPIPPEIVALTGITDNDVRDKRIDEGAVLGVLEPAVLVIAHNAAFDRPVLERRFPALAGKHWACSQQEVPWVHLGSRSSKLDYLLYRLARAFHNGHRASDDCLATLHLLASPLSGDTRPLDLLLQSARRPTLRLWATGTPIEVKDALKNRGYRWFPGSVQKAKGWYRDLASEESLAEEKDWLRQRGYGGSMNPNWKVEKFTSLDRYSTRMM